MKPLVCTITAAKACGLSTSYFIRLMTERRIYGTLMNGRRLFWKWEDVKQIAKERNVK